MRHLLVFAIIVGLWNFARLDAQQPVEAASDAETHLDPDDVSAVREHLGAMIQRLPSLLQSDPDAAERLLEDVKSFVDALEPTTDDGKEILDEARRVLPLIEREIQTARSSMDQLQENLRANPSDPTANSQYYSKLAQELSLLARSDPEAAEKQLSEAKAFVASLREQLDEEPAQRRLEESYQRLFDGIEQTLKRGKRHAALIGSEAAALDVDAWVNGEPLTDADLKGKVVLLDFWAVWCGPCIATFPHLRQWHEQYADQGLELIGVTNYYEFRWDDEAGRPVRDQQGVSREDELKMLERFAEEYQLDYRFAVTPSDSTLAEQYGVGGIPQVVLIDRQGLVRLIRVGSGEDNARDIDEMLKQLIAE